MATQGKGGLMLLTFLAVTVTVHAGPLDVNSVPTLPATRPSIPDFSDMAGDLIRSKFDIDDANEDEACGRGFPKRDGNNLGSKDVMAKFAEGIRDTTTKEVFGMFKAPNPLIDFSQLDMEDVRDFLEFIVDDGGNLLNFTANFADLIAGDGFEQLVHFVVDHPEVMRILKKSAVKHVLANLTVDSLEKLCDNLDHSDLSEISLSEILKDFPQCVDVAQGHVQDGSGMWNRPLQHGRVVVDRIRSTGLKLNVSDFLLDPWGITVEDVNGLKESDLTQLESLKVMSQIVPMLDRNVVRRLAERVVLDLGKPSTWDENLYQVVGPLLMHLPDDLLQRYVDDYMLELYLDSDIMLSKRIVSFMVESLYAKRNAPSFHKRFCLSILHHPYITVTMLDDFTPRELWNALKECPQLFYEMAYTHADALAGGDYYYYYDEEGELEDWSKEEGKKEGGKGSVFKPEWDSEHVENAFKEDIVESFLVELKPHIMQLRPLMRRLFPDRNVVLNETQLRELSVFLPAVPAYVFKNLPSKLLMKMWPKMQRFGKFPVKTLEIVMDKFDSHLPEPKNANASTAFLLGQALLVLPCGVISEFPGKELVRFVLTGYFRHNEYFSCEINEILCRTIARKALKDAPEKLRKIVVDNLGPLSWYLDIDDFEDEEIFFNGYLPDSVERDMFKRKEKDEKDKASKEPSSKFELSDEERVLDAFVKEEGKNGGGGKKKNFEEVLYTKFLEMTMIDISLNFTGMFDGALPTRFNFSYLENINVTEFGKEFSLKQFGDIEEFLSTFLDISFDDILDKLMAGVIDPDLLDFEDEDNNGFLSVSQDFLEDIPENIASLDFLKNLKMNLKTKAGKNGGSTEKKQLSNGFKVIKNMFQLDSNQTDICLDESVIESVDCYFTTAWKHELEKLSNKTRKALLKAEGNNGECVASMSQNQLHQHFESLLDVDDELREAKEWKEDMLMIRGPALLCGMEEGHVAKLTPQAAVRLSDQLCHCRQLGTGARKAIFNKIKEHYDGDISNIFKPPYNTDVASCLMYAPQEELTGMSETAKKIFIAMASKFLDEVHDYLQRVEDMNYFGVEDLVEERLLAEDLAIAVWTIMEQMDVPAIDRLSHLSHFKSVINVDFLDGLSDADFDDALDYLQDFDEWTDDQKRSLDGQISKTFGDAGNWSDVEFQRIGGLLSAHLESSEDFEDIEFDECAMDFVLERFADNENLLESICDKLTIENALHTIKNKPQAICCLDPEDATSLNATFIMKGLDAMGRECHPCLKKKGELLSRFGKIVSQHLRSQPDNETIKAVVENLKCLAGKMPEDFLENLPVDVFDRLGRDALEVMEPSVFCKTVNKDYLKGITSDKIEVIDDSKLECLDNEKFEAIWEAVDGPRGEEYFYDNDESFIDLSVTEIGDAEEFDDYLQDFSAPITQSGVKNQAVRCVSPRGENVRGMTDDGKRKLRKALDGDELDLYNEMDLDSKFNIDLFSEADVVNFLEEADKAFNKMSVNFTQFFADLPYMVENPNIGNHNDVLEDAFENLNPRVYTTIKPSVLCNSLKKLKKKHLEKLCGRLLNDDVSTQTFLTVNSNCPVCFTYWIKERKNELFYNILDKKTATAFFGLRLREDKPLDLEILALGPKGVTPDVIKAVDPRSFGSVSQLTVLSHPNVAKHIPKNSIKMILQGIVRAMGPIKKWNSMLKSRLQFFLFHLPRKDLKEQLTPSDVIDIVRSRDGRTEGLEDPDVRKILGQAINKYVMKKSNTMDKDILESPQVFCLLLSSGMPRKLLDPSTSPYDPDVLLEMASECSEYYDISPSASKKFFRAIISKISKNGENLSKMKNLLKLLPSRDISKFPDSALKALWSEVKDQEFDEFQLRYFWKAIKDDIKNFDCGDFKKLGQLLRVVPRSLIEGASSLFGCLDDVMKAVEREDERKLPKSIARGLWKMIKTKLKQDSITVSDFVMRNDFPVRVASLIPKSEYDSLTVDFGDRDVREKAFKIAENIGDEKSDLVANLFKGLDLNDPEIQDDLFENEDVARVVFSYMDDDTLDQMQSGDSEGSMLEDLADDVEHMSTRALEKNFGLMKKRINLTADCEKESVCMDEGQAWVMGSLFIAARPNEMECFTKTTRRTIIQSIGQNKKLCKRMTSAVIQKLFSFVDPSQAIRDGEDLEMLYGCMICGLTKSQIQTLTDEQVALLQDTLPECHQFGKDVKDVIKDKIYSYYGGFQDYLEANPDVGFGTLLMSVPLSDIKSLDGDALEYIVAALGDITSGLSEKFKDLKERKDRREISASDYDQYSNTANAILSVLFDRIVPSSTKNRRKRAVANSDEECDILSTFNGNLCFLTEVQINALSDQTVADCAAEFQQCSFSESVFITLATKAKNALGTVSDWTTNNYASLGKLLGYMGDSTISQMELTDDVMSVIPNVEMEDGDDIINQYLAHNSKDLSDLSGENIADLSLLLGSFDAEDLNELEPSAVADAAITYDLGGNDLSVLDDDIVELFTNKLIESDALNFTEASSSDISNLGALAGKLPENILTDLTTDQKSGISADAIQLIDPDVLANSFTASDFSALTSDQANALSSDQLGQLSSDQRTVVTAISTTVLGDDSGTGRASTLTASLGALVASIVFVLWTIQRK